MPGWTTAKIFISSTFRDMQAERDWLVRFIFPRVRERLAARRVRVVDVDLRWGITSDANVLEACTEDRGAFLNPLLDSFEELC